MCTDKLYALLATVSLDVVRTQSDASLATVAVRRFGGPGNTFVGNFNLKFQLKAREPARRAMIRQTQHKCLDRFISVL